MVNVSKILQGSTMSKSIKCQKSNYLVIATFLVMAIPSTEAEVSTNYFYTLFSRGITNQIWDNLDTIVSSTNVSTDCRHSLQLISDGIKSGDLTAFRFLDASAKVPSGLLDGTISSFGDYDQCLRIDYDVLKGKHCIIKLVPSMSLTTDVTEVGQTLSKSALLFKAFPMSIGVCLPSKCSNDDVRSIAVEYLSSEYLSVGGSMSATQEIVCDTIESVSFDVFKLTGAQILSLLYLTTMMSLTFWSTLLDVLFLAQWPLWYKSSSWRPALQTFSVSHHAFNLFNNHQSIKSYPEKVGVNNNNEPIRQSKRVSAVDNIRFMFAVVTAGLHSIGCAIEYRGMQKMLRMKPDFADRFTEMPIQPFFNVVGIEAFFCIGGITTYLSCGHLFNVTKPAKNHGQSVNNNVKNCRREAGLRPFFQVILYRFLRLFPCIMTLVAIDISIWPLLAPLTSGGGPLYTEITNQITSSCTDNWFKSALLINNWTDVNSLCLIHTWYLSAEFQLFLLGVLSLYLFRYGVGVIFCYAMILVGMVVPALTAYIGQHSPTLLFADQNFEAMNVFTSIMYLPTHNHLSPYFIGILVAHYYKCGTFDLVMNTTKRAIGFLLFCFYVVVLYAPGYWNSYKVEVDPTESALYVCFHRVLWTLGFLSSIMFMKETSDRFFKPTEKICSKSGENSRENSQVTNDSNGYVLSRDLIRIFTQIFLISSKLYFSLYLIHPLFIKYDWFTRRTLAEFTPFASYVRATYSLFFSMVAAFWFHLLFEAPFESMRAKLKEKLNGTGDKTKTH